MCLAVGPSPTPAPMSLHALPACTGELIFMCIDMCTGMCMQLVHRHVQSLDMCRDLWEDMRLDMCMQMYILVDVGMSKNKKCMYSCM